MSVSYKTPLSIEVINNGVHTISLSFFYLKILNHKKLIININNKKTIFKKILTLLIPTTYNSLKNLSNPRKTLKKQENSLMKHISTDFLIKSLHKIIKIKEKNN